MFKYSILTDNILNFTTSIKNCENLIFDNLMMCLLASFDTFLKVNIIIIVKNIKIAFINFNFQKDLIKKRLHINLHTEKREKLKCNNKNARGLKKRKFNIEKKNKEVIINETFNLFNEKKHKLNNEVEELKDTMKCKSNEKKEFLLTKEKESKYDAEKDMTIDEKSDKIIEKAENEIMKEINDVYVAKKKVKLNVKDRRKPVKSKNDLSSISYKSETKKFGFMLSKEYKNLISEHNKKILFESRINLYNAFKIANIIVQDIFQKYEDCIKEYVENDCIFLSRKIVEDEGFKKCFKSCENIEKCINNILSNIKCELSEIIYDYKFTFVYHLLTKY